MRRMRTYLLLLATVFLAACDGLDRPFEGTYDQVLIYYGMGYNDLQGNLRQNIKDLQRDVLPALRNDKAILAFLHTPASPGNYTTPNPPVLMRIYRGKDGNPVCDTLKTYPDITVSASAESLTRVMNEIRDEYPARRYGMIVSSHGSGWLPPGYNKNKQPAAIGEQRVGTGEKWIELPDFAKAIPYHLNFLILDTCLSGCVEVAWELRNVTDQLIVSPAEILRDGMGYSILSWDVFAYGEPDFHTYCKQYFDYYDGNGGGTISLVDCKQLDPLAEAFHSIIDAHRDALNYNTLYKKVQRYYYSSTPLTFFYDLRDLAAQLGASSDELARLDSALAAAIPCHYETDTFFDLRLERCCGLSVYLPDPSRPTLNAYYKTLGWNQAVGLVQ